MSDLQHILPLLIPILGIVMGIGIGMLALWLDHQKKTRIFELHHQERMLAIERGMEVPPFPLEFLQGRDKPKATLAGSLRWGLIWLFLGVAIAIGHLFNDRADTAVWALMPIAVGLALLIFYSIGRRQELSAKALPASDSTAP
jgi:hypothetical protein